MTQMIGLNDSVMVKINKIGLQHLEYEHNKRNTSDCMWCDRNYVPPVFVPPPTDPCGYTVMPFTLFMTMFSNFNWCGAIPNPIDGEMIVIKCSSKGMQHALSQR